MFPFISALGRHPMLADLLWCHGQTVKRYCLATIMSTLESIAYECPLYHAIPRFERRQTQTLHADLLGMRLGHVVHLPLVPTAG